jgi:hypothetical protein
MNTAAADLNTRIAALIAASPAAGLDPAGIPAFLLQDAALKLTMAQDDMNQQLNWLASAVQNAQQRITAGGKPDSSGYGSHGANLDIALAKLDSAQKTFNTIAATLAHA